MFNFIIVSAQFYLNVGKTLDIKSLLCVYSVRCKYNQKNNIAAPKCVILFLCYQIIHQALMLK